MHRSNVRDACCVLSHSKHKGIWGLSSFSPHSLTHAQVYVTFYLFHVMFAADEGTRSADPEPQTLLWTLQWVHTGSHSPFLARCFRIMTFKKYIICLSASQYFPLNLFLGVQLKNQRVLQIMCLCYVNPRARSVEKERFAKWYKSVHHCQHWTNQGFV